MFDRLVFSLLLILISAPGIQLTAAAPPDFQRDVEPIFAEHCAQCHGVDAKERKSGLRLDLRENALKGGDSGMAALVPGQPEQSELVRRISSQDADELMPPPNFNKPLSAKEIEILTQWVRDGAKYESHWAFTAPQKAPLPDVGAAHPLDAFVVARLKERGLTLSPEANRAALCRRLYLDLIGLPPSPAELTAFEQQGFEATVDTLLASERFGEKWARHWLDVARYSDTNGYEKDMPREQWKWRDWVVEALNRDLPYDQFVVEQLAGDLLPGATQQQIIATGFLRNSMINEEGAIVPEQFRMVEMFDRLDCLGKAVLGLTTQCAQCHSHKFDPLTHKEYYGMFAFLNTSYEAQSWVYTPEQERQIAEIERGIHEAEERLKAARPQWQQELAAWEQSLDEKQPDWAPLVATELGSISGLNHPTQEADLSLLMEGHPSSDVFMIASPVLDGLTGLRIEALNHRDLPHNGPGRSRLGTWVMNELEVFVKKPDGKDWEKQKLVNATADFSEPDKKQPDGKKASGPVAYLIDGTDDTSWTTDRGIGRRNQPSAAVVQFEQPLQQPAGTQLKIAWRMGDMLGCCRFSVTRQPAPAAPPVDHAAMLALAMPSASRTAVEQDAVFAAWRRSLADAKPTNDEIDALWSKFPQAATSILHLAEQEPGKRRKTYLLDRGNWDQPLEAVEPHTPAAFHPFKAEWPLDRVGFARWLTERSSPLAARVAVNRAWQAIFGTGLVETAEDFGTRAPVPEYRELLDWLAVDFMDNGWSQKRLIRTIVTSAIYRQSSQASPELLASDPRNQWLARGPRFRADAEVVRDIALCASGLITHKLGGPSIIPPVPQNVLDYNFTYPAYWKPAEGAERYRRTLYGFRKRSMPDPVMSNFDAPNADFACARRVRSNTPLAALTALNESIFVEAARALALRVLREGGADDLQRADYAFCLCTSRRPTEAEREIVLNLLQSRRKRLAEGWLNPRDIVTGDPGKLPELPAGATPQDAAAWMLTARVLLNLDETITKR
ncbi:MAG TPA: PSD1 and planctomycete cytochrome C domain-containing protein [Pirellulales bacterium]|nr:PSD1 and planctomycete cytochrome C domain-containing protein [Pirellulales bacterium]